MVTTACPLCGMELQIPEKYIGQQGRCKCCNQVFTAQPVQEKKELPPVLVVADKKWNVKKAIGYAFLAIIGIWVASVLYLALFDQTVSTQSKTGLQKTTDRYIQRQVDRGVFRRETPSSQSTKPEAGFQMPGRSNQIVTYAHYTQIQNGMTYEQVVSIIGKPGEEMSRNHIDGVPGVMNSITTVMYSWMNGNGSNMNAMFQNNSLMQKAQFGLR